MPPTRYCSAAIVDDLAEGFRLLAVGHHDAVLAPVLQGNMQIKRLGLGSVIQPGTLLSEGISDDRPGDEQSDRWSRKISSRSGVRINNSFKFMGAASGTCIAT